MKLPYRILVLDDDANALSGLVELLGADGHDVSGTSSYEEAREQLTRHAWDLFIADVRLRGYNGLNLVRQCRAAHPETAVIIISGYEEALMELEASRYQAVFLKKPIQPAALLRTVRAALAAVRRQRRWPRKRVERGFRVTAAGRPAAVVDVSYGGLRLEVPAGSDLPASFSIEVSGIGLQLEVQPVWSVPAATEGCVVYGAALASDSTAAAKTWRAIVDRLSA